MEPGDKKIRIILTIPQIQALQSLLQDVLDGGDDSLELSECNTLFKLKLFQDDLGIVKPTSIVAPKRPTLTDKLGFDTGNTGSVGVRKSGMTDEMHIAALNKSFEHLFKDAPVYNEKQVAWIAFDNGNLGNIADVDHLHTPDSKYEWLNDLHKGRIPPGKARFNEETGLYE